MVVDHTLSFNDHIESIVNKTKKVCGMVKRAVGYNAPSNVKLQLYKSVCRPNVEYSSQVWSPHIKQDIKAVESVQRGMTRFIVNNPDLSYAERCHKLTLRPYHLGEK